MSAELEEMLQQARGGEDVAQGKLLSLYESYLKVIAQTQLDRRLRRRISPSDLVQETMLEAHRDFANFRGNSDAEFLSWLRRILVNNLMQASEKHLQTNKRDVRREVYFQRLHSSVERSNSRLENILNASNISPSAAVMRQERLHLLADALEDLSSDHRQVILLRHIEGLQFEAIAKAMDRTAGACRMLWLRAMDQLRGKLRGIEVE